MRKIVFFDVDTQYDFMNPGGRLYVRGAKRIIPSLKKLTRFADKNNIIIVSSLDAHIKNDPEFKVFPRHCVRNSSGARKIKETLAKKTRQLFLPKRTYDAFSNPKAEKILKNFDLAFVYGVALDYCVKSACLGLMGLGVRTYLIIDATKPVTIKGGQEIKKLLRKKGVVFIKVKEAIKRLSRWIR